MKVFISGGAGVIARQLIPILLKNGHVVYTGDLKPKPAEIGNISEYIHGDLNKLPLNYFDKNGIEVFINLAASFERTRETLDFWNENFQNNINLSHHLMTAAQKSKSLKRILFASSYLVYDEIQYLTNSFNSRPTELDISSYLKPRNLIGSSKLFHENELGFLQQFGELEFSVVIPRIYRGYGMGSRDVISRWIQQSLRNESLEVFDAQGMFDYIYCKDAAMGIYKLVMESSFEGVLDLGSGNSNSIESLLEIILRILPSTSVNYLEMNSKKIEKSQANVDTLIKATGWRPEYTLENAIFEMVEYEKLRNGIRSS